MRIDPSIAAELEQVVPDTDELMAEVPELIREVMTLLATKCPALPTVMIGFVKDMLQYGEASWRKPCLWIIEALLDSFDCSINDEMFTQLSELLVHNVFATDEETTMAAEVIGLMLLENAPKSYRPGAFKFVRDSESIE